MSNTIKIGEIEFGGENRALVIPEIGINHEGSLSVAKEMVDAAKRAGARIVKHQTHIVEDEMCEAAKQVIPGNSESSIYDVMARCALSEDEEYELMQYVQAQGMVFLSTPFSRAAANRLEEFGVKAYKIGSGEMNNYPLLEHIASFGKPVILSTGMNSMASIKKAVAILENARVEYALMHTTNLYPTPPRLVRLGALDEMMSNFPNAPVGLSDHTQSNLACIAAIAKGADLVERHFTDVKTRKGPDIVCSMDEADLRQLFQASQQLNEMLGGTKEAASEEQVTIDFAFASVVSTQPIQKGEAFTQENLWVKRPGKNGIPAEKYSELLGRRASCNIPADIQIQWNMLDED